MNQTLAQNLSRADYAKQVAYLAQKHPIHWALTVAQIVQLGRLPHLSAWQRHSEVDDVIIKTVMQQTQISALAHRSITELSGGEQARVLLARAMAVQAPILLADEPVTSLDPYHQLRVMSLLKNYAQQGHLVVAVLHDFKLATHFCDHIILLQNGQVVDQGQPSQVLSSDNLMQVYQLSTADLQLMC